MQEKWESNKGELGPDIFSSHDASEILKDLKDLSASFTDFAEKGFKFKSDLEGAILDTLNGAGITVDEMETINEYVSSEKARLASEGDTSKLSPLDISKRYPDMMDIKEKINNSIVTANR